MGSVALQLRLPCPRSTENAYSKLPAAIAYGHINFRLANLSSLPPAAPPAPGWARRRLATQAENQSILNQRAGDTERAVRFLKCSACEVAGSELRQWAICREYRLRRRTVKKKK